MLRPVDARWWERLEDSLEALFWRVWCGLGTAVDHAVTHRRAPSLVWAMLLGVIVAPLVTWLPMLGHRFPKLGLPPYHPATGIDLWSMQTLWAVLLGAVAVFAWRERDYVMALALAWVTVPLFLWGGLGLMVPTHAVLFAAGCLLVLLIRKTDPFSMTTVRRLLVLCGLFQAGYAIQQRVFNYDLLWGPHLWGPELGKLVDRAQPLGTLGTVDALGSFVAITAPLMSPWLLPVAALAVACTKSYTAIAAFLAGVTTLCWIRGARRIVYVWALVALVVGLSAFVTPWKSPDTFWSRLTMLDFGARLAWNNAPVMGFGLGGWSQIIPAAQAHIKFVPSGELWREAHNEIAQWGVETGLVGLALFVAWAVRYRRLFLHRVWGGSAVALAVSSLGFFPFHVVPTALLGLLIVGLGTAEQSPLTSEG